MPELSRFNVQTNAVLNKQLETLSKELGLSENQQLDLLAELTSIASWVIRQTQAGRSIEARDGSRVELLETPMLERLKCCHQETDPMRIVLNEEETVGLRDLLKKGLQAANSAADQTFEPPKVTWRGTGA